VGILLATSSGTGSGTSAAAVMVMSGKMVVCFIATAYDGEIGLVRVVGVATWTAEEVEAFVVAGCTRGASSRTAGTIKASEGHTASDAAMV
jgi:hypothetical protein